jgi:cytochrome oxidase Cu insertion factor (SCO1/SenC/PrrC family)/thiol-disulfide isomerase/thioredoxin
LLILLALALVAWAGLEHSSPSERAALASNPSLDPGTTLHGLAPDFTLSDQLGQPVSLHAFRGRVVILAFNDSECTTICPLTTTAMLDAKAMLGSAGARVQLLGVDANPKALSVEDVLSYSRLHGMLDAWQFLTGSYAELKRVWKAYSIGTDINQRTVDHTPAVFIIGPDGQLAKLYVTQPSYAAVDQFAQILATEAARLLPDHPAVNSNLSYQPIPGTSPATSATLPSADGGTVSVGPKAGARLYLFFATWDQEITSLAGQMQALGGYQREATARGLPPLTAVDEARVEPSGALSRFLSGLAHPLPYPVALDRSGRLADGYEVEGEPWFVLVTADGQIAWYWQVATSGWLTTEGLTREVRNALARAPKAPGSLAAAQKELAGSPAPLAALHRQAGQLLGSTDSLRARIRALRGYPVVVNIWASWCTPCKAEFSKFAGASARFGKRVGFLGANADDSAGDAQAFLRRHPVTYPSYATSLTKLRWLAIVGNLPTTVFISPSGKVAFVHIGQYDSQGTLDGEIARYALGS